MRSVGIREVKAKLSEYLRYVRRGETVLVTDHGVVIAQLAPPPRQLEAPFASERQALDRLVALGLLHPAEGSMVSASAPPLRAPVDVDVARIVDDVRGS
jgi:antitoxin (DNA-binding transcriptional repressor) of toxin-antitoxin stability system